MEPSRPHGVAKSRQAVVLAGMHRSGTSLTSSLLVRLGIDMGRVLIPADSSNRQGYFEDADFVRLHQRMFECATRLGDGGHRDWGWTEGEYLDRDTFAGFREAAGSLVRQREAQAGEMWGWKDPRTTLLLDFWDELISDARYLLVYRHPWEVADSMQRLGAAVFLENPEYAYRIWVFYNRLLLDFYRRHRERCLLLSSDALVRQPSRLLSLLRQKFDLPVNEADLDAVVDSRSFVSLERGDPLSRLIGMASPEVTGLLSELDEQADLSSERLWSLDTVSPFTVSSSTGSSVGGDSPTVSVVVPCYDHGQFLLEAIASVERHAPRDTELVIVDDGSTATRTVEILDRLQRGRYQIVRQENSGLSAARNAGIRAARGHYILPLDADNRLRAGLIERASSVLDGAASIGVVYGDCWEFGSRSGRRKVPDFDPVAMLWTNRIDACAMFRREVWEQLDGYDPGMLAWEDWDFWLGAYERGWRFHRLSGLTFDYRVRPRSLVSRTEHRPVRDYLLDRLLSRHQAIYSEHQKEILLAAWNQSATLYQEREDLSGAQAHLESELRRHHTEFARMREEQRRLETALETDMQSSRGDVQRLETALRRADAEIRMNRRDLRKAQEQSASTAQAHQQVAEAHEEILGQLQSSWSWALLNSMRRVFNRLVPHGAGRRKVYERAVRLLRRPST